MHLFKYGGRRILCLWVIGITACTEVIEISLDSTPQRLVVYGTVTTDSVQQQVQLSRSGEYFSNAPAPAISNAVVELEFGSSLISLREHDTIPGLYLTPTAFRGIPGTTYLLHISEVDLDGDGTTEFYAAQSTMPQIPQLDSINLLYFLSPFVSGYQVLMYAKDGASREWYNFKLLKNQALLTTRLSDFFVQTDDFFNGTYIYGLPVGFLADDDPEEVAVVGDTVTFELNSIDHAYYNFIVDSQLEIAGNNPLFSGPSANVRSNINNEGKGIFTAYSISRATVIVKP